MNVWDIVSELLDRKTIWNKTSKAPEWDAPHTPVNGVSEEESSENVNEAYRWYGTESNERTEK